MEKSLSDRIYGLLLEKGYDVKNDCHAATNAVKEMIKKGILTDTSIRNKKKVIEDHVYGRVTSVRYDWVKNYCDFFGCSADYLLGFMEKDIADMEKRSGLSEKAIRKLKTNKDYLLVTNTLLENNGIDYIVKALQEYTYYLHSNTYIANQPKAEKKLGVTHSDLDKFKATLKSGNNSLKEGYAIVCFDNILKEQNLVEYFLNQADDRFLNQLEKDIKEKGSKLSAP